MSIRILRPLALLTLIHLVFFSTTRAQELVRGHVRFEQATFTQALDHAQKALTILDECNGEGPEIPHRDYFVGYQVLNAAGQTQQAKRALQAAYRLVSARAEKITESKLRRSFLERVVINREIVVEYRQVIEEN